MQIAVNAERKPSSSARQILVLAVLAALLAGLLALSRIVPSENVPPEPVNQAPVPAAVAALTDAGDQLLVWRGNGAAPGQHSGAEPGQLAWMDGVGVLTPLMDMPPQVSRVTACGEGAKAPDGSAFAFYLGLDVGNFYIQTGTDAPALIDDVEGLACLGGGTFQFSPDSARFGYIAFEPGAVQSEFADGFLKIFNTADLTEALSYENVVALDLHNAGAAFISFFTNDKNEADEAAVFWWNGSAEREVATVTPLEENCKFTSAQVAVVSESQLLLVMGHRCTRGDTRTSWQLYSVDTQARSLTLLNSDFQAGTFAAFARTNQIWLSPSGTRAIFAVPDGVTANTVSLKALNLSDATISDVVERQAVMPTFSGTEAAVPQVSPDGIWLAVVVTSPGDDNTLTLINLADPAIAPITLSAGSSGDQVSAMAFTPDSQRLIAVIGGTDSANNSLVAVELAAGTDFRIARGRFGAGLALSPTGEEVALLDWQVLEDPQEPPYANTVVVNVNTSEIATLFTGAEIVDGKVTNQKFVAPLVWRRAG